MLGTSRDRPPVTARHETVGPDNSFERGQPSFPIITDTVSKPTGTGFAGAGSDVTHLVAPLNGQLNAV
jgi:hypothetical protein